MCCNFEWLTELGGGAEAHAHDRRGCERPEPARTDSARSGRIRTAGAPCYGVRRSHYATVGTALLWTLEKGLGDAFTPDVRAAWTAVYTLLAETMQRAAACAITQELAPGQSDCRCVPVNNIEATKKTILAALGPEAKSLENWAVSPFAGSLQARWVLQATFVLLWSKERIASGASPITRRPPLTSAREALFAFPVAPRLFGNRNVSPNALAHLRQTRAAVISSNSGGNALD